MGGGFLIVVLKATLMFSNRKSTRMRNDLIDPEPQSLARRCVKVCGFPFGFKMFQGPEPQKGTDSHEPKPMSRLLRSRESLPQASRVGVARDGWCVASHGRYTL